MALMTCDECGEKVSNKAGSCPHCGAPIKLDEIYSNEEKDIVTVKMSNFIVGACCLLCILLIIPLTGTLYTTTSLGIYSFIPMLFIVNVDIIIIYICNNSYLTLTNKRVTGKIAHIFRKG